MLFEKLIDVLLNNLNIAMLEIRDIIPSFYKQTAARKILDCQNIKEIKFIRSINREHKRSMIRRGRCFEQTPFYVIDFKDTDECLKELHQKAYENINIIKDFRTQNQIPWRSQMYKLSSI